jgi:hypothetical protein
MAKFLRMMMLVIISCTLANAAQTPDEPPKLSGKVSLVRGSIRSMTSFSSTRSADAI